MALPREAQCHEAPLRRFLARNERLFNSNRIGREPQSYRRNAGMRSLSRVIGDHTVPEIGFAFKVAERVALELVQRFIAHRFLAHEKMSRCRSVNESAPLCGSVWANDVIAIAESIDAS